MRRRQGMAFARLLHRVDAEFQGSRALYLHLARASEQRRRPFVRDKLLLIAGAQSVDMGLDQIANYCRHKILAHNPGHLLRRFPTLAAARDDESFLAQLRQAQRAYPREKVEHMLDSLGIEMSRERDTYFTDHEYAASLLGTTPEELEAMFGESSTKSAAEEAINQSVAEQPNPYQSPIETRQPEDASNSDGFLSRRTPLPFGLVVLLTVLVPLLLLGVLSLLLPVIQWLFRG